MKKSLFVYLVLTSLFASVANAGPYYVSGKITSLSARGDDPSIRLTDNVSPELCDGGTYGWLYFQGTPEQKDRIYSTALALSLTGKTVTVYTNNDNQQCRIHTLEVLDLN